MITLHRHDADRRNDNLESLPQISLRRELSYLFNFNHYRILSSGSSGYWSNLSREENRLLLEALRNKTAMEALLLYQPWLGEVIFSPKRQAGLELLELKGTETCIDYGCMWGSLTIPLAKRTDFVLGIDQTLDSLRFLKARIAEEALDNIELLCLDLKKMPSLKNKVDIAIINGVLEWIPEYGHIELKSYYGKFVKKRYDDDPGMQQLKFLKTVYQNLKNGGKLYLAIENRYDFKMFMGIKDPHANLLFTSFLPRRIADIISMAILGRPYVNWLYSFVGIKLFLQSVGFSKIDLYMCFPDYRFPDRIIPFSNSLENYVSSISIVNSKGKKTIKRVLARIFEDVVFKILKAKMLAPAIIAIGHK